MIATAIAAGLIVGLALGTLGGGGAIITVPALVYLLGQDPHAATTGALVVVAASAAAGLISYARADRVRWGDAALFAVVGTVGTLLGSWLSASVRPDVLLLAFGALLLVVAVIMWRRAAGGSARATAPGPATARAAGSPGKPHRGERLVVIALAATGVGLLTGFFGVGGGFAIVPALVLVVGLPVTEAVGTSLAVIVANCVVALGARLGIEAAVDWAVVLTVAGAAVVGSVIGARLGRRLGPRTVQRTFAAALAAIGTYVLVRTGLALG